MLESLTRRFSLPARSVQRRPRLCAGGLAALCALLAPGASPAHALPGRTAGEARRHEDIDPAVFARMRQVLSAYGLGEAGVSDGTLATAGLPQTPPDAFTTSCATARQAAAATNFVDARAAYEAALVAVPEAQGARALLAESCLLGGDLASARAALGQIPENAPVRVLARKRFLLRLATVSERWAAKMADPSLALPPAGNDDLQARADKLRSEADDLDKDADSQQNTANAFGSVKGAPGAFKAISSIGKYNAGESRKKAKEKRDEADTLEAQIKNARPAPQQESVLRSLISSTDDMLLTDFAFRAAQIGAPQNGLREPYVAFVKANTKFLSGQLDPAWKSADYESYLHLEQIELLANPQADWAYANMSLCRQRLGDTDRAIGNITRAIGISKTPKYLLRRGRLYFGNAQYREAAQDFSEASQLNSSDQIADFYAGVAHYNAGATTAAGGTDELHQAEASLNKYVSEATATDAAVNVQWSKKLLANIAAGTTTAAVALSPSSARAEAFTRMHTALEAKDWKTVVHEMDDVLAYSAGDVQAMNYRADALFNSQLYTEAIAGYTASLAAKPDSAPVLAARGRAYMNTKEWEKSAGDFDAAYALDKSVDNAERAGLSFFNLAQQAGDAAQMKTDFDRAVDRFGNAASLDPKFAAAQFNRALALDMSSRQVTTPEARTAALDAYTQYSAQFPDTPDTKRAADGIQRLNKLIAADAALKMAAVSLKAWRDNPVAETAIPVEPPLPGNPPRVTGPLIPITRYRLLIFLYETFGGVLTAPAEGNFGAFADVPPDILYTDAAFWAQRNGLVIGYPDGTLGGRRLIVREEAAILFARLVQHLEAISGSPLHLKAPETFASRLGTSEAFYASETAPPDVPTDHWCFRSVQTLMHDGLLPVFVAGTYQHKHVLLESEARAWIKAIHDSLP